MQISVTTPALLFPAISLFMLAFTNRFLSLGGRVRSLHDQYRREKHETIIQQIENLRIRIHLTRRMQGYGVLSMLSCIFSMICIFSGMAHGWPHILRSELALSDSLTHSLISGNTHFSACARHSARRYGR